jgi:DivIVA domain-containing protein
VTDDVPSAGRKEALSPEGQEPLRTSVPAEIRNASFSVSVRGYDRDAVDEYVKRVNRVIAELEVSRSPQAAVRHAVDRVTEQTKSILQEARESAEQITATAEAEGEQIVAAAKVKAADLVVSADSHSERVNAETAQLLSDTQAEAEGILARTREEAAEQRRQAEEQLSALHAEAEARMHALQADTKAVWSERDDLLEEIQGMAGRLQDAAREAAARVQPHDAEPSPPAAEDGAPTAVSSPAQDD